jgi:hypothetical protein
MVMTKEQLKDEELKMKANYEGYQIVNMSVYKAVRKHNDLLLFIVLCVAYLTFFFIGFFIGSTIVR